MYVGWAGCNAAVSVTWQSTGRRRDVVVVVVVVWLQNVVDSVSTVSCSDLPSLQQVLSLTGSFSLIDWLIDSLIDWLTDWLIDWLIDWLTDWLTDCYTCLLYSIYCFAVKSRWTVKHGWTSTSVLTYTGFHRHIGVRSRSTDDRSKVIIEAYRRQVTFHGW